LGRTYEKLGEYDKSIFYLRESGKMYPGNPLSGIYINISEAKKSLLKDNSSDLHTRLGWNLFLAKEYGSAEAEYKEAIDLDKNNSLAYNNLALLYIQNGYYEKAEKELTKALPFDNNAQIQSLLSVNMGRVCLKQKRYSDAKKYFSATLRLNPTETNIQTYYELSALLTLPEKKGYITYKTIGDHYINLSNYAEAIVSYDKAIALNSGYCEAHNNLGYAYYLNNEMGKAIAEYDKALNINPKYLKARYNLGVAYKGSEKYSSAIKEFRELLSLDPKQSQYHIDLAYLYWQTGDYKNAKSEFEQVVKYSAKEDELSIVKKILGVIG
jgi:tetratricopeptide (TPR) repeat protein